MVAKVLYYKGEIVLIDLNPMAVQKFFRVSQG